MKLRYAVITCIVLQILKIIASYIWPFTIEFLIEDITSYALFLTLIYAIYVGIRKSVAIGLVIGVVSIALNLWPVGLVVLLCTAIKYLKDKKRREAESLETVDEVEAKLKSKEDAEKEILRKSNEILIHLVQDKGNQK